MPDIIIYHGTSSANANLIIKEGFKPNKKNNWEVISKKGFVYASYAYAPFFAMMSCEGSEMALIKIKVKEDDCYPDDDFIMRGRGFKTYSQDQLNAISLENYQHLWKNSLDFMGGIAAKPKDIEIIGVGHFNGKKLIRVCDPTITPINYRLLGDYYQRLTKWLFEGKSIADFNADHMIGQENNDTQKPKN